ncbi:APC family permease [Streptantibioticus silvisoli]|uniref:APC family permease n=1 Tax=Streptantibioticus silvisoli TaxID=2705255 RepID=A0ABT6VZ64_9ACTN|nr:APC family permease [Streptantibioticus silvisoli]MDI5963779.1 APC family permease [Streptantibioticus silvisoli]
MVTAAGSRAAGESADGTAPGRGGRPLIGQFGLISMAMSGVIGSGWLLAGQDAFNMAGDWAWVSWVIGAAALGCMALVMVALATRRPHNGALVRWPTESSGKSVGTIIGAGLVVTFAANMPTEAAAVVRGLCPQVHSLCTSTPDSSDHRLTWTGVLLAAAVMTLVFSINWLGLTVVTKVNVAFTVAKFFIPLGTAVLLFCFKFHWNPLDTAPHGGTSSSLGSVLKAVTVAGVVFGFTGFQGPIDHAGEANPRHLRRAVLIGLGIPAVLYTALQVAYIGHLPFGGVAHGMDTPYMSIARSSMLPWLAAALFVDGMASPFATALVFASFVAAELRTAAEQGLVKPLSLSRTYGSRQVPRVALIANFALGMLMLLLLHDWESIVSATGVIALFVYSYTAVSYTVFRRTWQQGDGDGEAENPFRRTYALLAPLSFTLATVLAYAAGTKNLSVALAFMFGVAILAFVFARNAVEVRRRLHQRRAGWLIGYFALLYGLRLLGSWSPGGHLLLPQAAGICLVAALGLGAYHLGVAQSCRYKQELRTLDDGPAAAWRDPA